jgi:hypothetical protein
MNDEVETAQVLAGFRNVAAGRRTRVTGKNGSSKQSATTANNESVASSSPAKKKAKNGRSNSKKTSSSNRPISRATRGAPNAGDGDGATKSPTPSERTLEEELTVDPSAGVSAATTAPALAAAVTTTAPALAAASSLASMAPAAPALATAAATTHTSTAIAAVVAPAAAATTATAWSTEPTALSTEPTALDPDDVESPDPEAIAISKMTPLERAHFATAKSAYNSVGFQIFELTPDEEPVELLGRLGGGEEKTTRLKSIAGIPINDVSLKVIEQVCKLTKVKKYSRKKFGTICNVIVAAKLGKLKVASMKGNAGLQASEDLCPPLCGPVAKKDENKLRLINCIFSFEKSRDLFAKFYQQPSKEVLTAREGQNEALFKELMEKFNDVTNEDVTKSLHPERIPDLDVTHHVQVKNVAHIQTMFRSIHSEYRSVSGKMGRSGNHGTIEDYTESIPVLYYSDCLSDFPDIQKAMSPLLPEGVARESTSSTAKGLGSQSSKRRTKVSPPVGGRVDDALMVLATSIEGSVGVSKHRVKVQETHYETKAKYMESTLAQMAEASAVRAVAAAQTESRLALDAVAKASAAEDTAFESFRKASKELEESATKGRF